MRVAHYRLWIYSVNVVLVLLQVLFMREFWSLADDSYLRLLPIHEANLIIIATFVLFTFQFFACFCGLIGVYFSARHLVRLYWALTIPIIIMDTIQALVWIYTFNLLHSQFNIYIEEWNERKVVENPVWCATWQQFQSEFGCCATNAISAYCLNSTSCAVDSKSCSLELLQWLHQRTDVMACLLYFLLYPAKLTVLFVLREDIMELVSEIMYSSNKSEFQMWMDLDKDYDVDLSSPSQSACETVRTEESRPLYYNSNSPWVASR